MFGRRNKIDRTLRERGVPPTVEGNEADDEVTTSGPFDVRDAPDDLDEYLDFGALKIDVAAGFEVRLEMSQAGELSGISLLRDGSIMQLGVFAAPRSGGAWETIRDDIVAEIDRSGGSVEETTGEFGPTLVATLKTPEGDQQARFIGVDGPRWFLRALIAGPVAHDEAQCQPFLDVFRTAVVDRGNDPKPVREPIALRLPQALVEQVQEAAAAARGQAEQGEPS
ncbi:DUF3710 domain-containing protein [Cumulibacter manganitolerans]|uniref:DUF3710 domain-containing protein n=1 Tax=Cumulibacter manganitolerans TaxID=1884992 RepID=UPI0012962EF5|nr:DUF3710 domain-containing protein [Cumulibacter manganitolerans]